MASQYRLMMQRNLWGIIKTVGKKRPFLGVRASFFTIVGTRTKHEELETEIGINCLNREFGFVYFRM